MTLGELRDVLRYLEVDPDLIVVPEPGLIRIQDDGSGPVRIEIRIVTEESTECQ